MFVEICAVLYRNVRTRTISCYYQFISFSAYVRVLYCTVENYYQSNDVSEKMHPLIIPLGLVNLLSLTELLKLAAKESYVEKL